jgi:hypothetical protein
MAPNVFTHSLTERQVLAVMNKDAVNAHVQVSGWL